MTQLLRTRRLALLVASTAIAAGGVLVPTTAFAATPTAPHQVMADGTDGKVLVPDGRQQWQCFAAPCEPPGGTEPGTDHHDTWDHPDTWDRHDKKGEHRPGRHDGVGVHVPDGDQQWQCFAAPCETPTGTRS
ncbi:hypothetical protein ACFY7Y_13095 [Streptomyces virginiae]|uniref:hypothetical protein n=1 Tax=Streptomyces virginiae TaxID=1961 RepID=UPI00369286AA